MLANGIKETTATTGTGTVTLAAVAGYARFSGGFAVGLPGSYAIKDGSNWEWGVGTVGAGNTLARTTITATLVDGTYIGSGATAITLASGAADVICTDHTGTVRPISNLTGHITSVGNSTTLGSFTAAELNAAVSDADVAVLGANTFTAAQELPTGTAIASAATVNLNDATGNRVHITGTTTITAVILTRGPRTVIFDGILTLTHHITTNNLPGGANILTAAGDRAIYESDGTTVYCVSFVKAGAAAVVPPSNGGATQTSGAVNITLTSASTRVQAVAMTASGKSVTLPDATTLTTGGALFVIKNTGMNRFTVRDSAGSILASLASGQIVGIYLSNNLTSAGVWAVGNQSTTTFLSTILTNILTVGSVACANTTITNVSPTRAIMAWLQGTTMQAVILDVSAGTLTAGTILSLGTGNGPPHVTAVSVTQAVITYNVTPADKMGACTLNISGTTLTAGAILNINIYSPVGGRVAALSATQVMWMALPGWGNVNACTLNISGTTITAGTVLVMPLLTTMSYSGDSIGITAMSATQAIVVYGGSYGYATANTLNVSGTTVTAGAALVVNAAASSVYMQVAKMSATQALLTYSITGGTNVCTLNVSGTTLTAGAIFVTGTSFGWPSVAALTTTKALLAGISGARVLNVNGTTVTDGDVITGVFSGNYLQMCALSASQVIVSHHDTAVTGFATATSIEVAS